MTKIADWTGAYDLGWKGLIADEAFSHPAKYSRALIFRIIEYALQCGLIQPGQTVVDPFGGVALGALPSLMNGLNWVGCELESRFVELGRQNIEMWNAKFSGMPKWTGTAQLLQGDSRRLAEVIAGAGLVVSSPPFAGNTGGRGEASRNGIDAALFDRHSGGMKKGTGSDPANLDHLPMGTVAAVIGSPPFQNQFASHDNFVAPHDTTKLMNTGFDAYGSTSGQLGAMVVESPPFENSLQSQDVEFENKRQAARGRDINGFGHKGSLEIYGQTPGQIGTESGETFWTAARLIVDQCYQILPEGGAAIWVVKAYVKNGKIVDFPGQWQALCEACGFETVEVIRAWLVKHNGSQAGLDGGMVNKDVARKSFFRRLAEAKGSPPIDFETVLVTRKRGAA